MFAMTNLSIDVTPYPQAGEPSTEIISVYELLADPTLDIPKYRRPYKWTGKRILLPLRRTLWQAGLSGRPHRKRCGDAAMADRSDQQDYRARR
jgi:hypothetical protein